jgi:hypothetical protein
MRWLFFTPIVILFYSGVCFYIGKRLLDFIRCFNPNTRALIFWLPFAFLCCALIAVNFFRHNLHFLRLAGSFWMTILLYLLMLLAVTEIVRLVLFLTGIKILNINLYTVGIALLFCVLINIYGVVHAHSIKTVNYDISLQGTGAGIRIVLVSDTHIGSFIGKSHLQRIVDKINLTQGDMVFLAGDIFDGNTHTIKDLEGVISVLRMIDASLGVFACLGNHDVDRLVFSGGSTEQIEEILKAAGIILLQDEVYKIRDNLYLAGRRDPHPIGMNADRKTAEELLKGLYGTIIVLEHQPTQFAEVEKAGADLLLCGHTHKGQLFPSTLITREVFRRAGSTYYGYWQGQTMQAVVTSGAAFWGPPLRVGTNSEIAVINVNFTP